MDIRYITCSDLREDVPIQDAINLLKISDKVELGIQAHPSAMSRGMPRNEWFNRLLCESANAPRPLNIALHVNYEWCSDLCGKLFGLSNEIIDWMSARNVNTAQRLIRRWQLNIGDRTEGFDQRIVADLIHRHPDCEFIFPYNEKESVKSAIAGLRAMNAKFSLLYDSSYGYGITPESWSPPAFGDVPQGYSGGLGPENVWENLDKISKQLPKNYATWIDAEGKLMKPGTRKFDVNRAADYVNNARAWLAKNKSR